MEQIEDSFIAKITIQNCPTIPEKTCTKHSIDIHQGVFICLINWCDVIVGVSALHISDIGTVRDCWSGERMLQMELRFWVWREDAPNSASSSGWMSIGIADVHQKVGFGNIEGHVVVVLLASADMKNYIKAKGMHTGFGSATAPAPEIPFSDGMSGHNFYFTWAPGNKSATLFEWQCLQSYGNQEMAHLSCQVMKFLAHFCMPWMSNGKVPCFTLFMDANGKQYRAHPSHDGKAWNDYVMVKGKAFVFLSWPSSTHLLIFANF